MVDWVSVEEARSRPDLRLVLAKGSWGSFSEAAKNIMHVDHVPYTPVPQVPFGENADLVAWTGVRNNPVAIYGDEPVRTSWLDILNLAERLSPEPCLLPGNSAQRALVVGLSNEICGENGLGWCRRIEVGANSGATGLRAEIMRREYRAQPGAVGAAQQRMADIMGALARRLHAQKAAGSRHIVGDRLTAVDVYWASSSIMMAPMVAELCPIPETTRAMWANPAPVIAAALDPILFEHRDYIYRTYLPLPMDFG